MPGARWSPAAPWSAWWSTTPGSSRGSGSSSAEALVPPSASALAGLQGEGERQPVGLVDEPPLVELAVAHHPAGQRLPGDAAVLGEAGHLEAVVEQRREDLAEAVVPRQLAGVDELVVVLDVGAVLLEIERLGRLEVGVAQGEPVGARLVDGPHHRVPLAHEEPPTGHEEVGDYPGPAVDVRQPAQGADAGVDEVEGAPGHGLD